MSSDAFGVKVTAPASTCTVAQGSGTGNLTGTYSYAVSFQTSTGETVIGPTSAGVAITGEANLSAIPVGSGNVTGRRLYRTVDSGTTYKHLADISDNTTTTYVDNIADGSLGSTALTTSTADSQATIYGYTVFDRPMAKSHTTGIVAVSSGTQPIISSELNVIATCPASGAVTMLPIPPGITGTVITIKNAGANTCTVNAASGNTIAGGSSTTISAAGYLTVFSSSSTAWTQIAP